MLEKINLLVPVRYDLKLSQYTKWESDPARQENERTDHMGFIAQDVENIFPQLVKTDQENGLKSMSYSGLIPVLVEAMQELAKKSELLEAQMEIQQTMLAEQGKIILSQQEMLERLARTLDDN